MKCTLIQKIIVALCVLVAFPFVLLMVAVFAAAAGIILILAVPPWILAVISSLALDFGD